MTDSNTLRGTRYFLVVFAVLLFISYIFWILGHPYLALAVSLLGAFMGVNHYLVWGVSRGLGPYWVMYLPPLLSLVSYAVFRDRFIAIGVAYFTSFVVFLLSIPAKAVLEVLSRVVGDHPVAVASSSALAVFVYAYAYGVRESAIAYWVIAGPFIEFCVLLLLQKIFPLDVGYGLIRYLLLSLYSVLSSLVFLQPDYLTLYSSVMNYAKAISSDDAVPYLVVLDFVVRGAFIILINLGRIALPGSVSTVTGGG